MTQDLSQTSPTQKSPEPPKSELDDLSDEELLRAIKLMVQVYLKRYPLLISIMPEINTLLSNFESLNRGPNIGKSEINN